MLIKKKCLLICASMFMLISLSACQSSSKSTMKADSANIAKQSVSSQSALYGGGNNNSTASTTSSSTEKEVANSAKIVKTATIQMQTLKFDAAITSIQNKYNEIGGYAESSNISGTSLDNSGDVQNRTATLKIRVPKDKYLSFLNGIGTLGNIVNKQETGENITEQYYDTDAHVESLKVQESRILELLKKSGDLTSILNIEKELQNVRYQIETLTTSLKKMDNMVDYTTFNLTVTEVEKVTPTTTKPSSLSGKLAKSFNDSINLIVDLTKNLAIFIAYLLPFIVIILILFLLWFFIRKFINKRFRNK